MQSTLVAVAISFTLLSVMLIGCAGQSPAPAPTPAQAPSPVTIPALPTAMAETASASLTEAPWPTFHGNLQRTGLSQHDTSHVDGTIKWVFETGGGIESSPAIGVDGTIYIGSHDGYLYAVD